METGPELTAHLTTGAVIVYSLQWVKTAGWFPWLSGDTKGLKPVRQRGARGGRGGGDQLELHPDGRHARDHPEDVRK